MHMNCLSLTTHVPACLLCVVSASANRRLLVVEDDFMGCMHATIHLLCVTTTLIMRRADGTQGHLRRRARSLRRRKRPVARLLRILFPSSGMMMKTMLVAMMSTTTMSHKLCRSAHWCLANSMRGI